MDMLLVRDVLLVEMVDVDLLLAVRCLEQLDEVAQELVRILLDVLFGVLADYDHLTNVRLGLRVALEAVLVTTLLPCLAVSLCFIHIASFRPPQEQVYLLAYLTVPPEPLETLGLQLVADLFRTSDFCARHDGELVE